MPFLWHLWNHESRHGCGRPARHSQVAAAGARPEAGSGARDPGWRGTAGNRDRADASAAQEAWPRRRRRPKQNPAPADGRAGARDPRARAAVIAADTSLVIAAFASWHDHHEPDRRVLDRALRLIDICALETYSVLTRLPAPHR